MRGARVLVLLAVAVVANPGRAAPSAPLQLRVSYEAFANLTYQLDCLTGHAVCEPADYEALWNRELLKTDADRKQLAAWKTVRARYQTSYSVDMPGTFAIEHPHASVSVSSRIVIAGLMSANLADYLGRLDLLVVPRERVVFEDVIRHFEPRFGAWWKREAQPAGAPFVKNLDALLRTPAIRAHVASFVAFYQPTLSADRELTFDLLYRPGAVKGTTSGQQLDGHSLVEFLANEDPRDRVDVVLHELCHFFYGARSTDRLAALQQRFLATDRPIAIPAYNLLDEALATAFGNGLVARSLMPADRWAKQLATDQSLYANPDIDRAGKVLIPLLDEWLAAGKTLDDPDFARRYIEALEKSFGPRLATPALRLGHMVLFLDDTMQELAGHIRDGFNAGSMYAEVAPMARISLDTYTALPNTSAIFVLPSKQVDVLGTRKLLSAAELRDLRKVVSAKGVVFAKDRNRFATAFFVVAETPDVAKKLLDQLAATKAPFAGVLRGR